jgi:hypothetical protein
MCCLTRLNHVIHEFGQMHPNGSTSESVQFRPFFRLIHSQNVLVLDRVDLTTDYEIVMHLFLPEVEVRLVELP